MSEKPLNPEYEQKKEGLRRKFSERGYEIVDRQEYVQVERSSGERENDWQIFAVKKNGGGFVCVVCKWDEAQGSFLRKELPARDLKAWGNDLSFLEPAQQTVVEKNIGGTSRRLSKELDAVLHLFSGAGAGLSEAQNVRKLFPTYSMEQLQGLKDRVDRTSAQTEQIWASVRLLEQELGKKFTFESYNQFVGMLKVMKPSIAGAGMNRQYVEQTLELLIVGRDLYLELRDRAKEDADKRAFQKRAGELQQLAGDVWVFIVNPSAN